MEEGAHLGIKLVDHLCRLNDIATLNRMPDMHAVLNAVQVDAARRDPSLARKVFRRVAVALVEEVLQNELVQVTVVVDKAIGEAREAKSVSVPCCVTVEWVKEAAAAEESRHNERVNIEISWK